MDWVHCNNCFVVPGAGKRFFLTSCGHIYCTDCKVECTAESCRLCGNQCSTIPLSSQMKPDVEMYFTDPLELLKNYLKQVQQVAEFQSNHRARLMVHQADQLNKLKKLKEEFSRTKEGAIKAVRMLKDIGRENKHLKKENEYLKAGKPVSHNMYRLPNAGLTGANSALCTPSYQESDRGLVSRGNSSSGSHRSFENFREFLSPSDSISSLTPGPSRISIRTPPMNGRIGTVGGATTANMANNRRSQGSTPNASPYSTPSSYPQLSELLQKCITDSGGRKVQLPPEFQGIHEKKASVLPFRSGS